MITKKRIFNVFKAYFYLNGKIAMVQENLTSSSLSSTAKENLIKNGVGNGNWASISSEKELNVELQTNVIDINQVAMAAGSAVISGVKTVHAPAKVFSVTAKKITLDQTPLNVGELQIVDIATDGVLESSAYTVAGKDVTFTGTPVQVKVLPYTYTSLADVEEIVISAEKFPEAGKLILHTVEMDEKQKVTADIEIVIEKCKPSADFTISTSSDVSNGNDNTISLKALIDDAGNLGKIRRIPRQ